MWTSEQWDEAYGAHEPTWTVEPHPHLVRELSDLPPGRAVELACGEGRQAIWLATRGWQVTAVDFSAVALARGRAIAEQHDADVDWVHADVLATELPSPVDLAVVMYLHVPSTALTALLGRAAAALAPGGTLFVLGWDRSNALAGRGPQPPDVQYDVDELAAAAAGLRVVRMGRVPQGGATVNEDAMLRAVRSEQVGAVPDDV